MEVHTDVVCPFCGCLCDDIEVAVEGGVIKDIKNGCAISRSKFLNNHLNKVRSPIVDGVEVSYQEAIDVAAQILEKSKRPVIYGLSKTDNEAIRVAINLTEVVGGVLDNTTSVCHGASIIALQHVGSPTMTLGEVKNRADLIIFWGSNPLEAHPRHAARYSVFPKGLFTPNGRKGRHVVVVDVRETRSTKMADKFIQIDPDADFDVFQTLRALLRGVNIKKDEVGGVKVEVLRSLVEMMKTAKVGCIFYGLGLNHGSSRHLNIVALYSFVEELNRYTKFAVSPMRGCYNVNGANNVATWQTGYPFALDMSRGYPRYNPGEYTMVDLLAREEVDSALVLGSDPCSSLPVNAAKNLARIPVITLERKVTPTTMISKVVIPVATSGVESEGTAYRMDGVPLRMSKVVEPLENARSDSKVLEDIIKAIEIRRGV